MMKVEPQAEHQWLHRLVGEWTFETDTPTQPGLPDSKATGTESVRSIGGVWIQAEGRSAMPDGGPATSLMTLGYDPGRSRFVGTWFGSMMTHLWLYDGELDRDRRTLTLNSEGPSMSGDGKIAKYQDIIEFTNDDERALTARVLDENGTWNQFMRVVYRRKK